MAEDDKIVDNSEASDELSDISKKLDEIGEDIENSEYDQAATDLTEMIQKLQNVLEYVQEAGRA